MAAKIAEERATKEIVAKRARPYKKRKAAAAARQASRQPSRPASRPATRTVPKQASRKNQQRYPFFGIPTGYN